MVGFITDPITGYAMVMSDTGFYDTYVPPVQHHHHHYDCRDDSPPPRRRRPTRPAVCNDHPFPTGGRPLGKIHRCAKAENMILSHRKGGCFKGGDCELLQWTIVKRSLQRHGIRGAQDYNIRQLFRLSKGMPAGAPDELPPAVDPSQEAAQQQPANQQQPLVQQIAALQQQVQQLTIQQPAPMQQLPGIPQGARTVAPVEQWLDSEGARSQRMNGAGGRDPRRMMGGSGYGGGSLGGRSHAGRTLGGRSHGGHSHGGRSHGGHLHGGMSRYGGGSRYEGSSRSGCPTPRGSALSGGMGGRRYYNGGY
ncbi:MAG: hypothetical protein Q9226_007763 [Calogaya cf. arnoldii]